jgi:hypothetical protein
MAKQMNGSAPSAQDTDQRYGLEPVIEAGRDRRMSPLSRFVSVSCPHCGGSYDSALDLTLGDQVCIEDCQVCCRSIELSISVAGGRLLAVEVQRADGS